MIENLAQGSDQCDDGWREIKIFQNLSCFGKIQRNSCLIDLLIGLLNNLVLGVEWVDAALPNSRTQKTH